MKKFSVAVLMAGIILGGCSFGEYADTKDDTTETTHSPDGVSYYKFTEKSFKNKTFYKTYKPDENWSIVEYDFNGTHFSANQIKGGDGTSSGKYEVTDKGYLKLILMDSKSWVKATKEDSDKIWLLWATNEEDFNKTEPSENTYFFKTMEKADEFVKKVIKK